MDLDAYFTSPSERKRASDILDLMPTQGRRALDVGANEGYFSMLMADRFESVTALDVKKLDIDHPRVTCVLGSAAEMQFADGTFDFVLCSEVLEHVPPPVLNKVCQEIQRVCNSRILVGVPYRQDIRVGRTTCSSCGERRPPFGHVNTFDEHRIQKLFDKFNIETVSFIGSARSRTNWLSAALMDFAGNPYGDYRGAICSRCGNPKKSPPPMGIIQRVATKGAYWLRKVSEGFAKPRPVWIHVLLSKSGTPPATGEATSGDSTFTLGSGRAKRGE
jgi:hypothetical protein